MLGVVEAAATQFRELISDQPHFSTGEYSCLGLCEWVGNRPEEAVAVWKDGLDCKMDEGAGGIATTCSGTSCARGSPRR